VNIDDVHLRQISTDLSKKLTYGYEEKSAQIKGDATIFMPAIEGTVKLFQEDEITVKSNLGGTHNFLNILAAVSVADYFEVDYKEVEEAISNYSSTNNRSQIIKTDSNVIISDAYNANPSSMEVAINNFASLSEDRKILMLGDMGELGSHSEAEHKALLENIEDLNFTKVYLAGDEFLKNKDVFKSFVFHKTTESLINEINEDKPTGAHILLKGSRFMAMDRLAEVL